MDATNERLRTELPNLKKERATIEKQLADVTHSAEGLMDEWAEEDQGTVFVKERLNALAKQRAELEASLEEVARAIGEVERDAVDRKHVAAALGEFSDLFENIPPYQQKELIRLVLQKALVSPDQLELAMYAKPPQLSEMTQGAARSGTSNWLPG